MGEEGESQREGRKEEGEGYRAGSWWMALGGRRRCQLVHLLIVRRVV